MNSEAQVESTCSEEEPYVVDLAVSTAGLQSITTFRMTLLEAKEMREQLDEAITDIEEALADPDNGS